MQACPPPVRVEYGSADTKNSGACQPCDGTNAALEGAHAASGLIHLVAETS